MPMTTAATKKRRPRGKAKIRKEERNGELVWGYDVWLRQPNGERKRFRDFTFQTRGQAEEAYNELKKTNTRARYGIKSPEAATLTTIQVGVQGYLKLALAKIITNKTPETTYYREEPGHLKTLKRFVEWIGPSRLLSSIVPDDFIFWIAAETERGRRQGKPLQLATIRRGLNTIRAALNHAVESRQFHDLQNYRVPKNPLKKKVEKDRDRVLSNEEIEQITTTLEQNPNYEEALFFFQLDIITGARMAELLRMEWDESSERFGWVRLFSTKTGKWRTIKAPAAAELIAKRKKSKLGGPTRVLTRPDHWFRDIFRKVSEAHGIPYGQKVAGGWTIHDIRHTCLTHLAMNGIPIHGIKEFAGHASILETQRYLKYMPEQIELAATVSTKLAQLANAKPKPTQQPHQVACPQCGHSFTTKKTSHLMLVEK